MVKVHEVSTEGDKLEKINTTRIFVTDLEKVEKGDFVFFKTLEMTFMTKVVEIYEDEGLKEGFKILKLNEVNW